MCSVPKTGKSMFPLLSTRYCCRDGWLVRLLLFAVLGRACPWLRPAAARAGLSYCLSLFSEEKQHVRLLWDISIHDILKLQG